MLKASSKHRLAVGIDLGTTNSLVATVLSSGQAKTLADEKGRHLLPSVVHYHKYGHTVGFDALAKAVQDPGNTIISIKRIIGRSLVDIQAHYPNLPYQLRANEHGLPMIATAAGLLNPVRISSDILNVLATRAKASLGCELDGAVITVPAYFDDAQRQETKNAAQLAGLHVLRLLNEPTAAAIAYGLNFSQEGIIAVYDLGGGTFDISILHLSSGLFKVLATGGDTTLGGDDFDQLLADYIREQIHINSNNDDTSVQRILLDAAIDAKIALSKAQSVCVKVMGNQIHITQEQFNRLIEPLVKRTLISCRRALTDAGVKINEILEVIMVGGSTRLPLVRKLVGEFFSRTPLTSINPDKVVAVGAAIQADILVGNKPTSEMLLLDVVALSLGLETMGGLMERVIPRNTTIPVIKSQDFTTFKDGQTAISIHIIQGEREMVRDCRSLARFTLRGIPSLPAGKARVRITFQVDADGLLSVTAIEKSTGIESSIQVKPSHGLTTDEIASMVKEAKNAADRDIKERMLAEQKIEAERLLGNLNNTLISDTSLFSKAERQMLDEAAKLLSTTVMSNNIDEIKTAIKNTNEKIKAFAVRRMNKYVRFALKDQSVDEV